jgi:hypothetical protein
MWFSTLTDQLRIDISICQILEKKLEYNETGLQLFIYFKKAYDSVRREVLYNILIEFCLPMKLIWLIKTCLNEMYSKVHIGKHLSHNFLIHNALKEGDTLFPFLFNFALEYAIRTGQDNQVGLKLIGTHQLLVYDNSVNLLGDNMATIKRNRETVTDTSKEVGLEENLEKLKYMFRITIFFSSHCVVF